VHCRGAGEREGSNYRKRNAHFFIVRSK
jgi:hypothetical protein